MSECVCGGGGGGGFVISPYRINKLSPRKTMMEI